jgi:hypothetical protein
MKLEPFSGEEMGTHYNFEAISAGSSRRIARIRASSLKVEAFMRPAFLFFSPAEVCMFVIKFEIFK